MGSFPRKVQVTLRALLLALLVSGGPLLACSQASRTTAAGPDGGGATGGGDLEMEGCGQFGLQFAPTCEACPVEPLGCPCQKGLADFGSNGFPRCNFGRCLLSVDCAALCKHAPSDSGMGWNEFLLDLGKASECVSERLCRQDSGCGDHGKCVDETSPKGGTCTNGDARCLDRTDCWSGICTARSVCTDGQSGSPCGADADCPMGKCLQYLGPGQGICTDGNSGHACQTPADCKPGNSCVLGPNGSGADLGTCLAGNADDRCDSDAQCKSGACLDMQCSSGEVDAPCSKDQHCKSGICLITPGSDGSCGSGENGFRCFFGDDCHSGICALKQFDVERGLCTDGKVGAPCWRPEDCNSSVCNVPRAPEPNLCNGAMIGQACGAGGTCGDILNALCYYGHCAQ